LTASHGDVDDAINCFPGAVSVLRELLEGPGSLLPESVEVLNPPLDLPAFHPEA